MRIEKLHLENIGVFDSLDLEFQTCPHKKAEIQIFTGINGSGKSTLLYALAGALVGPFRQKEHLISQRFQNNNAFVEILFGCGSFKLTPYLWQYFQAYHVLLCARVYNGVNL